MSLLHRRNMMESNIGGESVKEWKLIQTFNVGTDCTNLVTDVFEKVRDIKLIMKIVQRPEVSSMRVVAKNAGNLCIIQNNNFGQINRDTFIMTEYEQSNDFSMFSMSWQNNDYTNEVCPILPNMSNTYVLQRTFTKTVVGDITQLELYAHKGFKVGDIIEIYGR